MKLSTKKRWAVLLLAVAVAGGAALFFRIPRRLGVILGTEALLTEDRTATLERSGASDHRTGEVTVEAYPILRILDQARVDLCNPARWNGTLLGTSEGFFFVDTQGLTFTVSQLGYVHVTQGTRDSYYRILGEERDALWSALCEAYTGT